MTQNMSTIYEMEEEKMKILENQIMDLFEITSLNFSSSEMKYILLRIVTDMEEAEIYDECASKIREEEND